MKVYKDVKIEIEVSDEDKNLCSTDCSFWVYGGERGRGFCFLFSEDLKRKTDKGTHTLRLKLCKEKFSA